MRWGLIGLLLYACVGYADAHSSDDAAQDIQNLYATWRTAVERSDIKGYVSLLHPKVRMLPPGAAAIDGADNYEQFLQPVFATATYEIIVEALPVISVLGDVAVAQYDYTILLHRKDPEVGVAEPGALTAQRTRSRYFDVLRRMNNGAWRVWRHSWQVM